jgi:GT2 family glycosyltransferase
MGPIQVRGKFLYSGDSKYFIRGATYGTFRPNEEHQYGSQDQVAHDFRMMREAGINSVRTYTVPPVWLFDIAQENDLRVMVGLPWEQHITFLDNRSRVAAIEAELTRNVRACAGHPAILAFTIGNEIPGPIVRWHGKAMIESFLSRLYHAAKSADANSLVTYVNYPTTEYLELPFLDFFSFNVYLEKRDVLAHYLAHLHVLAGNQPLVMAEIGLDSRRNGLDQQAQALDWQIRETFASGCAGAFAFSWTDEWYRGGHDIDDWDFGLVTRERTAKPALAAVSSAFTEAPIFRGKEAPSFSVILCSRNGARTIEETLRRLDRLDYPNYEVIVVNDGSTDATPEIAARFPQFRLISVPNGGLSQARNLGMEAAKGEFLAYIDDDAYPDPHWLSHLAHTYLTGGYAAVGGPNIPPPNDGVVAACVGRSPGGPMHVMLTDTEAEHIPGCNFSVRRECLAEIGGFDPRFRIAGDDVDVCWRLLDKGWQIGFHPAAMVWHHCRNTVKGYWKQQKNYGKAEALLEQKWPERYNGVGHVTWSGRVYGGTTELLGSVSRIYFGVWGTSPFQSIYRQKAELWQCIPAMPEWYLGLLASVSMVLLWSIGARWHRLWLGIPMLLIFAGIPVLLAFSSARKARYPNTYTSKLDRLKLLLLTSLLHLLQPVARLSGRLLYGIRPWRLRGKTSLAGFWGRVEEYWSETWVAIEDVLSNVESTLLRSGAIVRRGYVWDKWDLNVGCSILGSARIQATVEEHGSGKQMFRFRVEPQTSRIARGLIALFMGLSIWAFVDGALLESSVMLLIALAVLGRTVLDVGFSIGAVRTALRTLMGATEAETIVTAAVQPQAARNASE